MCHQHPTTIGLGLVWSILRSSYGYADSMLSGRSVVYRPQHIKMYINMLSHTPIESNV